MHGSGFLMLLCITLHLQTPAPWENLTRVGTLSRYESLKSCPSIVGINTSFLQFILASSSRFFLNVLSKNPEVPLIYLSRIRFVDLTAILDFMYSGEVRKPESWSASRGTTLPNNNNQQIKKNFHLAKLCCEPNILKKKCFLSTFILYGFGSILVLWIRVFRTDPDPRIRTTELRIRIWVFSTEALNTCLKKLLTNHSTLEIKVFKKNFCFYYWRIQRRVRI